MAMNLLVVSPRGKRGMLHVGMFKLPQIQTSWYSLYPLVTGTELPAQKETRLFIHPIIPFLAIESIVDSLVYCPIFIGHVLASSSSIDCFTESKTSLGDLASGKQRKSYWTWPSKYVDFPMNSMVIFHSYVNVYQRVITSNNWVM